MASPKWGRPLTHNVLALGMRPHRVELPAQRIEVDPGLRAHAQAMDRVAQGLVLPAHEQAGLFSAVLGGWARGAIGSSPVTREVKP